MDIRVYLTNGNVLDYCLDDPATEAAMLADLQVGRLFSAKTIIIGGKHSCSLLQADSISRIDLLTQHPIALPDVPAERTMIEDEQAFCALAKAAAQSSDTGTALGGTYKGYGEFLLAGGHKLLIQLERKLQDRVNFFSELHRVSELPFFALLHPRGGVVIINVKNLAAMSYFPGLAEYPKGTLTADRV